MAILVNILRGISKKLRLLGLHKLKPLLKIHTWILNLITPEKMTVNVNGCLMEVNKSLGSVSVQVGYEREYEVETTVLISKLIKEKQMKCVVDVGANIGYYTLLASKIMGGAGTVYAVEPDLKNIRALKRNLEINKITNVQVVECAISNKEGETTLYVSKESSGCHSIIFGRGTYSTISIKTRTLDSITGGRDIDLIKIDTEGADLRVLTGAESTINRCHPVIFVECWEEGLIKAGDSVEALLGFLLSHNYSVQLADNLKVLDPKASFRASADYVRQFIKDNKFIGINLLCQ